jgi:PAS domain S-box-containing protein
MYLMTADMSRYIYINPPIERLLGYPAERFLKEGPAFTISLMHPEDLERVTRKHNERLAELNAGGASMQGRYTHIDEYRLRHRDGSWKWVRSSAIVFEQTESGDVLSVLGVAQDITEQRELEQKMRLSERMASLGQMAAGMAHGINNPLAHLIASIELANERVDTMSASELRTRLADMHASAERIRQLVRELKVFSRPENDERVEPVSLQDAFESIVPIAMNEVRPRARLVRDYAHGLPRALGNGSRVGQVLLDLVINAAQAIPDGNHEHNEIRLSTRLSDDGSEVVAEVGDTGQGMPPEVLSRIFEPFYTTKPVGRGTGLGLALAYQAVRSLGGTLEAESLSGRGSVFRVRLPRWFEPASQAARPDAGAATAATAAAASATGVASAVGRGGRILVLDDDVAVAGVVRDALSSEHEIVACTRAEDALAALAADPGFDLVLCDLIMPKVNGAEFYARAVKAAARLADRFVFMTGGAFTEEARRFLESSARPTLYKPFRVQAVRELARKFVPAGPAAPASG